MDAYVQHDSPWITLHFSNTEYAGRSGGRPRETIDEIIADLLRHCARGEKSRGRKSGHKFQKEKVTSDTVGLEG